MAKKIFVFVAALCLLALAGVAGGYYYFNQLIDRAHNPGAEVIVYDLKPGTSLQRMISELEAQGVWTQGESIALYLKFNRRLARIKVGEYEVSGSMSPKQILQLINSGKSKFRTVTVPEGDHIVEVAKAVENAGLVSQDEFLKAVRDPVLVEKLLGEKQLSLEGYLYPETYQFTKYTTLEGILQTMVSEFKRAYAAALNEIPEAERGRRARTMNRHQLVTMASIIEKETGAPEERPLISSVFYNRLDKNMRLQTDPTILYGKFILAGQMPINISRADLTTATPYNTYVIMGLPPGPISNPGKDALKAALKPAISNYLFFVSKNDGTHVFSENYQAHEKAVNFFQKNARQREGKSWRDLKKKTN